jgi:transcriptional activator SPT8
MTGLGVAFRPSVRREAVTASTYDIVPTIAAPQSTSINTVTATPDMRWVFSGGSDGYIRKFSWPDSVNAKLMLTVAQRHPFVDSVVKAGVLLSYWENEDATRKNMSQSLKALTNRFQLRHPDKTMTRPIFPQYILSLSRIKGYGFFQEMSLE